MDRQTNNLCIKGGFYGMAFLAVLALAVWGLGRLFG